MLLTLFGTPPNCLAPAVPKQKQHQFQFHVSSGVDSETSATYDGKPLSPRARVGFQIRDGSSGYSRQDTEEPERVRRARI